MEVIRELPFKVFTRAPRLISVLVVAMVVALSQASLAQSPLRMAQSPLRMAASTTEQISIWDHAFYKMVTYETVANGWDYLLLGPLFGAGGAVGAAFMTANVGSAAGTYYAHEIAWDLSGVPPTDLTAKTVAVKAAGYRVLSITRSFLLAYAFFGVVPTAAAFAVAGAFADTVFFVANEYAWDLYGPRPIIP